jgi:hypothetical protein
LRVLEVDDRNPSLHDPVETENARHFKQPKKPNHTPHFRKLGCTHALEISLAYSVVLRADHEAIKVAGHD